MLPSPYQSCSSYTHNTLVQPLLTCQRCPRTPALQSAPPAWRWAGTAWPATLSHTPGPSPSLCSDKPQSGRKQSSCRRLLRFCCHRSRMWSPWGRGAGRCGTGPAPTDLPQPSSPPGAWTLTWSPAGCLPDWIPSGYHTGHLWCCQARHTQSLESPLRTQMPGIGSRRPQPGGRLQSTDMPGIWRE